MPLNRKMTFYKLCFFVCLIAISIISAQSIIPNSFAAEKERFVFVRNDNIWTANTEGSDSAQLRIYKKSLESYGIFCL